MECQVVRGAELADRVGAVQGADEGGVPGEDEEEAAEAVEQCRGGGVGAEPEWRGRGVVRLPPIQLHMMIYIQ